MRKSQIQKREEKFRELLFEESTLSRVKTRKFSHNTFVFLQFGFVSKQKSFLSFEGLVLRSAGLLR